MTDTSWAQRWGKERAGDESPEPKELGGGFIEHGALEQVLKKGGV